MKRLVKDEMMSTVSSIFELFCSSPAGGIGNSLLGAVHDLGEVAGFAAVGVEQWAGLGIRAGSLGG